MKRVEPNHSSGVYMVRSKLDHDLFYIGASTNLQRRKIAHVSDAKGALRNVVKSLGATNIEFKVLKYCPAEHLEYWEQFYISELNPPLNTFRFSGMAGNRGRDALAQAVRDMGKDSEINTIYTTHRSRIEKIFCFDR